MIIPLVLFFLMSHLVQGDGNFFYFFDDTCDMTKANTYEPINQNVFNHPDWWDGLCLYLAPEGSNPNPTEWLTLHFNQSFTEPMSAYFKLQIWQPTTECGHFNNDTVSDIFEVSSSDWPDITCREGLFTQMNVSNSMSIPIWITVVPDPVTQPSSTGLPPQSNLSSTGSPHAPVSFIPFPFDSSILSPSGTIMPESTGPAGADESHSSVAMIVGVVSGVAVVAVLIAVGVYCVIKRRRRELPSRQGRSSVQESLYSRDLLDSDY